MIQGETVRGAAVRRAAESRRRRLLREWAAGGEGAGIGVAALAERLSAGITRAVHLGQLREGDRIPSIREAGAALSVPTHQMARVYRALDQQGLIERRPRSGAYARLHYGRVTSPLGETADWLAAVLSEACEHRIRIPYLPDLIRSWTATVQARCACVESELDSRVELAAEVSQEFGLEAIPVDPAVLATARAAGEDAAEIPREIRDVHLFVTTAFHLHDVRALALSLDRPLLVATTHPDRVLAVEERLRLGGALTIVCADPRFGERMRALHAPADPGRMQVVLADDASALTALDRKEAVLMTRAAHDRIGATDLRLLYPLSPAFAPDFSAELARVLVRLNLAERRT